MANAYGPYSTSNTLGVNVHDTYAPENDAAFPLTYDPPFAVGQVVEGTDDGQWVFCTAGGPLVAGDVLQLSPVFAATQVSTANGLIGQTVGVAPVNVTSGHSFWAQTKGFAPVINIANGVAANAVLGTSATPGRLGTGVGIGPRPLAIVATSAPVGNLAPGLINEPVVTVANP